MKNIKILALFQAIIKSGKVMKIMEFLAIKISKTKEWR